MKRQWIKRLEKAEKEIAKAGAALKDLPQAILLRALETCLPLEDLDAIIARGNANPGESFSFPVHFLGDSAKVLDSISLELTGMPYGDLLQLYVKKGDPWARQWLERAESSTQMGQSNGWPIDENTVVVDFVAS